MAKNKQMESDILIVGGGVPGLTLAALLAPLGIRVTIADKNRPPPVKNIAPGTRTAALMEGSVNVLKATGAWDRCARFGAELKTLRIIDDSAGRTAEPAKVDFAAPEISLNAFGINMPNAPLRAALGETVSKLEAFTFIEAQLLNYEADGFGITARLGNGDTVAAKLLIGADGARSATREIAGIRVWERDYSQQAITCLIDHSKPHDHVSTEFHRPSGPFTLVPLPGNRSSVVWVDFAEPAERYMAMSKHAFERALQERSRDVIGKIALAAGPQSYPLRAMKAKSLTAKRVALIAEAAHVLHPMGAQGLNLSLRDVAALAEIIADSLRLGLDPGSAAVLAQYERRRRQDVLARVIGTDGLNRIVSNNFGLARSLRRIGLKTLDHVTPLKEFAMQQGLAPRTEDGRLAKGEAL